MKVKPNKSLTQQAISEHLVDVYTSALKKPNPPTSEDIERAKFVDKTYRGWTDTNLRSGN